MFDVEVELVLDFVFVGVLGIPYLDVVRVLAAVILLGNVQFIESSSCLDVDVEVKVNNVQTILLKFNQSYSAFKALQS